MSSESARRAPMMPLSDLVSRYRTLAGEFGLPIPLSAFQLDPVETERLFSGYDEDYHISRFFHFSQVSGPAYSINGFEQTHISIDEEIQSIL